MSRFPAIRMRRLRRTPQLRRLVRETHLAASDLIWPLFIKMAGKATEVRSMPGVFQHPLSDIDSLARRAVKTGIGGVLLFGIPESKDETGEQAYAEDGVIQQAVRAFKSSAADLVVVTDLCLCEYTSHGHCGVVAGGEVQNDETVALLGRAAVSQAEAGADLIAPSDMMDGRVAAIRRSLDDAGFESTPIMSYAAKYASTFYGPFRDAAESAPRFGDRRGYQMDPANGDEAMREIELDIAEGADIIMVKPGMPCLDILWRAKQRFDVPLAAYQVSGEYSMIKFAAQAGAVDGESVMLESLISLRRAGAKIIITYAAPDVAARLGEA